MDVWVPALFGLLGAVLGATGAMWSAKRTTDAAISSAFHQRDFDQERWVRDRREAAYTALLSVDHKVWELTGPLASEEGADEDSSALWRRADEAGSELELALTRIRLTGPPDVEAAANELYLALGEMLEAARPARDFGLGETRIATYVGALGYRSEAQQAFQRAARLTLGFSDQPGTGQPMTAPLST
ncbi:hypothetical protein [Streptomyces olivaceoviridis]|uniref:hypothetical protein n=1 Tax=Streptomyces olivaceoviridis TaxID=1921 RepID=UPI0037B27014